MRSATISPQLAPVSYLIRVGILILVISFERVVGLPILTLGLALQWAELLNKRDVFFLIVSTGVFLAVYYQMSFAISILVCAVGFTAIPFWVQQQRFMTPWVAAIVVAIAGFVGWWGDIPLTGEVVVAGVVSFTGLVFVRQWRTRRRASTTWF